MNKYELNNIRIRVTNLLNYGVVSNEDIRSLSNQNIFEMSNNYNSEDFRSKVLFTIYINPYILCDDSLLNDRPILSIEDISSLLIKRYNEEIRELKNHYYEGDLNLDQMYIKANQVRKLYFDSSLIGRRIYRIFSDDIEIINKLEKNLKFK